MPSGAGTPEEWGIKWRSIKNFAEVADRDPDVLVGSAYVTMTVSDDLAAADQALDEYLEGYYNQPAALIREQQYCFAGSADAATQWLGEFAAAGASHIVVRFTGSDDKHQMQDLLEMRTRLRG